MRICSSCCRGEGKVVKQSPDVAADSYLHDKDCLRNKNSPTRFYCCGTVPPLGPYRKRHGMYESDHLKEESSSSIEFAIEADENENYGVTKILRPDVPYIGDLPEQLYQGRAIEIQGRTTSNPHRFTINLSTSKEQDSDICFHFNPRFDRRVIIRNHRTRHKWGIEEIASLTPFPFTLEKNFTVLIFIADEHFMVAVNKVHFCAFTFRLPLESIRCLVVTGDVVLDQISHYDRTSYPPRNYTKVPYIIVPQSLKTIGVECEIQREVQSITPGTKIEISGRLKALPNAFYVNLQNGVELWPHPIIPVHMNMRIFQPGTHKRECEIIFNTWSGGSWGKEEVITNCPFLPGDDFQLTILYNHNHYLIHVNNRLLYKYTSRHSTDIDTVLIHGDVIINKVVLKSQTE